MLKVPQYLGTEGINCQKYILALVKRVKSLSSGKVLGGGKYFGLRKESSVRLILVWVKFWVGEEFGILTGDILYNVGGFVGVGGLVR